MVSLSCEDGAPGRIRTSDHLVRSQVLYPAELRALNFGARILKSSYSFVNLKSRDFRSYRETRV